MPLTRKVGKEFLIADGLRCRFEAGPGSQTRFRFGQKARLHHPIHPQVDAAVELGALREIQPQHKAR